MGQSKPFPIFFDPTEIELLSRAIERAWEVIKYDEPAPEAEARELLAVCIMNIVRSGEDNFVKVVNRSIVSYREQRDGFRRQRAQLGHTSARSPVSSEGKPQRPN